MDSTNNKKGVNHTVAVSVGVLLLAAAISLSVGSVSQQGANAQQTEEQQQQTQSSNATVIANTTATDTFSAKGIIAGTIPQGSGGSNASQSTQTNTSQTAGSSSPFLVGGDWSLELESGNVTDFKANFTMVKTDGFEHHSHDITNFKIGNNTNFQVDPAGRSTINGTADYAVNGTSKWPGSDTTITIEKAKILTIQPQEQEAKQHFQDQPIYGIVMHATGGNGSTITETAPAGGNQTQQEEGGILEQLTEPFEDLFGGE